MTTFDSRTETVQLIDEIDFFKPGNFSIPIQHSWQHYIKLNEKVYEPAMILLSYIIGWYKSKNVYDENGHIRGYENRFNRNKLQLSIQFIASETKIGRAHV